MFHTYHRLLKLLRKQCPLAFPARVRRVKLGADRDGYCSKREDHFQIRINNRLDESGAIETLLHEWAHAKAWNHFHDSLDQAEFEKCAHDAAWGVAYSEVYRIFEKHFE